MATFNKNYSKKLQDPRWQQKRLRVLERDNFSCKLCGSAKTTLDVHHHLYESGKDPWEYNDDVLDTYCRKCHGIIEFLKKKFPSVVAIKIIWKDNADSDFDLAYVIVIEKKKVILVIFQYYHQGMIEILAHVSSNILKMIAEISNIHHG